MLFISRENVKIGIYYYYFSYKLCAKKKKMIMDNNDQRIDKLAFAVEKQLIVSLENLITDSYLGVSFKTLI